MLTQFAPITPSALQEALFAWQDAARRKEQAVADYLQLKRAADKIEREIGERVRADKAYTNADQRKAATEERFAAHPIYTDLMRAFDAKAESEADEERCKEEMRVMRVCLEYATQELAAKTQGLKAGAASAADDDLPF